MNKPSVYPAGITVQIGPETQMALEDLSEQLHQPVESVLTQAVEVYWRQQVLDLHNAAYAALREDQEAWQEEIEERAAWDSVLTDGLNDEPDNE